jgi:hypothetical protein
MNRALLNPTWRILFNLLVLLVCFPIHCARDPEGPVGHEATSSNGPIMDTTLGWRVTDAEITQTQIILTGMAKASESRTVFFEQSRPWYVESNYELARVWLRSSCYRPKPTVSPAEMRVLEISSSPEGSARLLTEEDLTRTMVPGGLQPVSRSVFFDSGDILPFQAISLAQPAAARLPQRRPRHSRLTMNRTLRQPPPGARARSKYQ